MSNRKVLNLNQFKVPKHAEQSHTCEKLLFKKYARVHSILTYAYYVLIISKFVF